MKSKNNIWKNGVVAFVIVLFLLPSVSAVESYQESLNGENDVELFIIGGFRFHWKVINHKDEPINGRVDIWMENFLGMGYEAGDILFTVFSHDEYSDWWDLFPMPFYRIYVTLTVYGEKTLKRTGIAILGFNIFLTKETI